MGALGHYAKESSVMEQWLNRALTFHLLTLKFLMYYHFYVFSFLMPQPGLAIPCIKWPRGSFIILGFYMCLFLSVTVLMMAKTISELFLTMLSELVASCRLCVINKPLNFYICFYVTKL